MPNLIPLITLASLLTIPFTEAQQTPIAAVILTRHGARTPLFKDTKTFTEGNSELTLEGKNQLFERGQFLRSRWGSGGSDPMTGFSETYYQNQTYVRSSDTDRTINSAQSLLQGLFPASAAPTLTLANGTTLNAPGTGDQQVPIHVVDNNIDYVLRGWFNCTKLDNHVNELFKSKEFTDYQAQHQGLLDAISPRFGRSLALSDMWNVFDYLNVQRSYNSSFQDLTSSQWSELTDMVNYLEYQKFKPGYAAANFINEVVTQLQGAAVPGSAQKFTYYSGHYTTFTNFFGLTGLSTTNTSLQAIPDYGSTLIFELLATPGSNDRFVRFSYRNGYAAPVAFPIANLPVIAPLADFVKTMDQWSKSGLKGWCDICGNTVNRGCETLNLKSGDDVGAAEAKNEGGVTPVVGGVIGAVVGVLVTGLVAAGILFASRRRTPAAQPETVSAARQPVVFAKQV
ncbi:hypothetical protein HK097_002085 [Rhizophlyctis rosea]|uniref:Uncharacterized protein n=1 Tax=Rhizophlyctis rosea TaxID=64517 RepID=A0AAD5S4R2_9FUNG|nr:hypothetical protein HK097_002085 [Rhizophlyctis rosea]